MITLSNCRTAGRYATPAALYLFLHTSRWMYVTTLVIYL